MLKQIKPAACGARRASELDSVGAGNWSEGTRTAAFLQADLLEYAKGIFTDKPAPGAVMAKLVGFDVAICAGKTTKSRTPILDLCRELIAEGFSPQTPLAAYRDGILVLAIRSIGAAAVLRVRGNGIGFEKLTRPVAPPVRQNGKRATRSAPARRANQRGSSPMKPRTNSLSRRYRRPHWHLSGGDVDAEIARAVLDHPETELQTDALPLAGGAFPQTYVIRKEKAR
jgi:hypothetical protein